MDMVTKTQHVRFFFLCVFVFVFSLCAFFFFVFCVCVFFSCVFFYSRKPGLKRVRLLELYVAVFYRTGGEG